MIIMMEYSGEANRRRSWTYQKHKTKIKIGLNVQKRKTHNVWIQLATIYPEKNNVPNKQQNEMN